MHSLSTILGETDYLILNAIIVAVCCISAFYSIKGYTDAFNRAWYATFVLTIVSIAPHGFLMGKRWDFPDIWPSYLIGLIIFFATAYRENHSS